MINFQQIGGVAALIEASCYIFGFSVFIFFLDAPASFEPVKSVEFLIQNQALILSTIMIIYIVASLVLLVLVLALHERLKGALPMVMSTATAFGLIWTGLVVASGMIFIAGSQTVIGLYANNPEQSGTVWLTINIVHNALGGGIELVGGIWILLVSWVALRKGAFSKPLNYLGIMIGVAGILTVIPLFAELAAVFGLGQIAWFAWIGIIMLADREAGSPAGLPKSKV